MDHRNWRGAARAAPGQDGLRRQGRARKLPAGPPAGSAGDRERCEDRMQGWTTTARAGAGTLAVVGIGTPLLAALFLPAVFPVVVVAGALWAWRHDRRDGPDA